MLSPNNACHFTLVAWVYTDRCIYRHHMDIILVEAKAAQGTPNLPAPSRRSSTPAPTVPPAPWVVQDSYPRQVAECSWKRNNAIKGREVDRIMFQQLWWWLLLSRFTCWWEWLFDLIPTMIMKATKHRIYKQPAVCNGLQMSGRSKHVKTDENIAYGVIYQQLRDSPQQLLARPWGDNPPILPILVPGSNQFWRSHIYRNPSSWIN